MSPHGTVTEGHGVDNGQTTGIPVQTILWMTVRRRRSAML